MQCCLANKTLPKTGKVLRLRTLTCENELVYGYVIDEFRDMQKGRNFAPFSLLFGGLDETPTEHLLFSYENISYKITHE